MGIYANIIVNTSGGQKKNFPGEAKTDWKAKLGSPHAWERLVAVRAVSPAYPPKNLKMTLAEALSAKPVSFLKEVKEAEKDGTLALAIPQLELLGDVAGLLVISKLHPGHALRALDAISRTGCALHTLEDANKSADAILSGEKSSIMGAKNFFIECAAFIAAQEKSVALSAFVFYDYLALKGFEKGASLLLDVFVEKKAWDLVVAFEHKMSEEYKLRLAPYIDEIATANKQNTSQILEAIAARHPEKSMRIKAIDAIRDKAVRPGWQINGVASCAKGVSEDAAPEFVETAKYAIDQIPLLILRGGRAGSEYAELCCAANTDVREYAVERLLNQLQNISKCEYLVFTDRAPEGIREKIVEHLEASFLKLSGNPGGLDGLFYLALHSEKLGMHAMDAIMLSRYVGSEDKGRFNQLAESAKNPEVREKAGDVLVLLGN
ncbi:MAG: hypothetical protein WC717_01540 [Candidatus Micrarchaeia archaeon]